MSERASEWSSRRRRGRNSLVSAGTSNPPRVSRSLDSASRTRLHPCDPPVLGEHSSKLRHLRRVVASPATCRLRVSERVSESSSSRRERRRRRSSLGESLAPAGEAAAQPTWLAGEVHRWMMHSPQSLFGPRQRLRQSRRERTPLFLLFPVARRSPRKTRIVVLDSAP